MLGHPPCRLAVVLAEGDAALPGLVSVRPVEQAQGELGPQDAALQAVPARDYPFFFEDLRCRFRFAVSSPYFMPSSFSPSGSRKKTA